MTDFSALDLFANGQVRNPHTGKAVNVYEVKERRSANPLFTMMINASDNGVQNEVVSRLEKSYRLEQSLRDLYLQLKLLAPSIKHPQQLQERLRAAELLGVIEDE